MLLYIIYTEAIANIAAVFEQQLKQLRKKIVELQDASYETQLIKIREKMIEDLVSLIIHYMKLAF